jgi:hypothetical protein
LKGDHHAQLGLRRVGVNPHAVKPLVGAFRWALSSLEITSKRKKLPAFFSFPLQIAIGKYVFSIFSNWLSTAPTITPIQFSIHRQNQS